MLRPNRTDPVTPFGFLFWVRALIGVGWIGAGVVGMAQGRAIGWAVLAVGVAIELTNTAVGVVTARRHPSHD
ncbi:MAG: hypothetical protein JO147_14155 [Actinobacteria bacterium]|nr:hypothetical protein [Actinomycetota bacterium]